MPQLIRRNAFETNSSSTHSLTIGYNINNRNQGIGHNQIKIFKSGNYEAYKPKLTISTLEQKVAWLLSGIMDNYEGNERNAKITTLRIALIKFMGYKKVEFESWEENDWGSFQDLTGDTVLSVFETKGSLERFLFSPNSKVEIV